MHRAAATMRDGRVELTEAVDWPEGTRLEVVPLLPAPARVDWFSLPPLDVGQFREMTDEDDLLAEMLGDSRD